MTKSSYNADFIRELAEIATKSDLSEIKFKDADVEINIVCNKQPIAHTQVVQTPVTSSPHIATPVATAVESTTVVAAVEDLSKHPGALTSPMIGVIYRSPNPESANFTDVGSSVKEGDTIMLIEAMKVFTPIKAPKPGIVKQILVNSGDPVEFGEVLIVIE